MMMQTLEYLNDDGSYALQLMSKYFEKKACEKRNKK
jgi:hypothetical protein